MTRSTSIISVSEIQAKVASQRNVLPAEAEDPVIDSTTGDPTALMYMAFYSEEMTLSQITDYLLRVVQPKLQAVPGVAKAELIGNKRRSSMTLAPEVARDDMREQIAERLEQERLERLARRYLRDLRKDAFVEVRL